MHNIIATLFGPVFSKELVEMARRKRYYLSRVVYGFGLLLVLYMVYESNRWLIRNGVSINDMARIAESFATALAGVQFAAVFVFVPLFLGGVVASEREERTLEQLFTTELTNSQIVLGKLLSRVVGLLALIACGLPILSIIQLFGGIDPGTMLRMLAATMLAVLYASAHAIYFSTITKSPLGALARTYWWMALWLVGVPIASLMILEGFFRGLAAAGGDTIFVGCLMAVNPIVTFVINFNAFEYNRMVSFVGWWFFPAAFVLPSLWSLFLIWRAVRRVRTDPTPFRWRLRVPFVGHVWRFAKRQFGRLVGTITKPVAWAPGLLSRMGPKPTNPLWLRAKQAPVFDREGYLRRIQRAGWFAAGFFFILALAVSHGGMHHEEISMTFLAPTWLGLCLMTTLIAGSSIVGDRRRGFFELVLATPLTPREIIDGTCLAVWEHVRRLYWLPWVLCLLFCLARASTLIGVCCSLITGTLFLALAVLQGVACSLSARTLAGALVAAFLLPVAAIVGTGMLIGIFEWGNGPALWILCLIGLPVTWFWVRRRLNPASVGCFLTTAHLSLAALFSCWTASRGQHELPIAAMHPGYIVMVTLSDPREYWFGGNHLHWFPVLFWYWSALVLNLAWLRWWLIRHFDRFVERPKQTLGGARPRAAKAPVASLAKST